jgi:RNA polymerase sigma-70 factor, ECF subfamily
VDIVDMNKRVIGFQDIYHRYFKDVHNFAYWLCGDPDEAKDITSEAFIRLWTTKNEIIVDTVKAYLFKIARNLFLQKRRNKKQNIELHPDLIDSNPQPDSLAEVRSELNNVLQAIKELPEIDRLALIMKSHDNLSYQEISRVLGISVSAIKVKIHRARLKLMPLKSAKGDKTK